MTGIIDSGISAAVGRYHERGGGLRTPVAVLFDMDGVLYDSMPHHARAWKSMCDENGIKAELEEFFPYEGRTGASTINVLFNRQYGRDATDEEIKRLYRRKTEFFGAMSPVAMMAGAEKAIGTCLELGLACVLVTGSGQGTLLGRLDTDYPGAFPAGNRVTAYDVNHGKPDPEPYLKGLEKAGTDVSHAIAVDNAPLGVESASRAGIFTIGVRTGPLVPGSLLDAGADIEVDSMEEVARVIREIHRLQSLHPCYD